MLIGNKNKRVNVDINNLMVVSEPKNGASMVQKCVPGEYDVLDTVNGYIKIAEGKYINAKYTTPIKEIEKKEQIKKEEKPLFEDKKIEVGEE
jgi:hypothetical protein